MFNLKELTLTVPAPLAGRTPFLYGVSCPQERSGALHTLGPIHPMSLATMLREHSRFALYRDPESTRELPFPNV
jgi:hypothetical protein